MRTRDRRVLSALAEDPNRELYGLEIHELTGGSDGGGLLPGTTWPVLHRFEARGLVTSRWKARPDPGTGQTDSDAPRRRYYRITTAGLNAASRRARTGTWWHLAARAVLPRPAIGRGRARAALRAGEPGALR